MKFLELFRRESNVAVLRPLLLFSIIAGACNVMVLIVMNNASGQTAESSDPDAVSSVDLKNLMFFLIAIFGFILSKKYTLYNASRLIEGILGKIRIRIINKVRFSEFSTVEKLDQGALYSRITQQTQVISQNAPMIMEMVASIFMLFFSTFYVIYLSMVAFIIVAVCTGIAVYLYNQKRDALENVAAVAGAKEMEIYESLDMVLNGFKEVRLNQKKSNAVFKDYRIISSALMDLRTKMQLQFAGNVIFGQVFYFVLIGVVLFGLPLLVGSISESITKITAAVLFFIGPLGMIVGGVPSVINTNEAIANLQNLEEVLDKSLGEEVKEYVEDFDTSAEIEHEPFEFEDEIVFSNLMFNYKNEKGGEFVMGPVDKFRIRKGEFLIIEGGNGSGKSTLLKVLVGLYYPNQGGSLTVDGKVVNRDEYQRFRELFAAIFTDFHLARKLYGLQDIDKDKADQLLKLLKIDDKTSISEDAFTDINLSTGQRKRLALLVTYLEDKSIYAFDEVAADQDPQFREYFYKKLLPELQAQGKTLIVISHDDRYFDCADRKIKMEYGKVIDETFYPKGEKNDND